MKRIRDVILIFRSFLLYRIHEPHNPPVSPISPVLKRQICSFGIKTIWQCLYRNRHQTLKLTRFLTQLNFRQFYSFSRHYLAL